MKDNGDMLDQYRRGELKGEKLKEFLARRQHFTEQMLYQSLDWNIPEPVKNINPTMEN